MEEKISESVLTLVGNIVTERPYGVGGLETRSGVRLFRAGAKVYLSSIKHWWVLKDPEDEYNKEESIMVIGLHRDSRALIQSFIKLKHITNIRIQVEYKPKIVAKLKEEKWPAFNLTEDLFKLGEDRTSQLAINLFLDALYNTSDRISILFLRNYKGHDKQGWI